MGGSKIEAGAQVTPNVRLVRRLGEGGMGEVWAAEHLALGTEVAVKFLNGDYASDEAARARFSQEAAAASRVKSSHVVKVYDYGITEGDVPFIVMEMLEGTDLARRLETEKKIAPDELLRIVQQLCKALERAHEKGVIHRDIKPENVFLGAEGGETFVKLLDFGVAKTETVLRKTTGGRHSTLAGESLGTPYYMSPEQFRSAKLIDARSDLWAVGVLAYEALTGVLPFVAETVSALAIVVNECKPIAPTAVEPSLPAALDAWFAKACAREPAERFQSARELSDALAVALGAEPATTTSGAHRRVVISSAPANETEHIALRDTAFATAGGSAQKDARRLWPFALVGVAVIGLGVGVWMSRARGAPEPAHAATGTATPVLSAASAEPARESPEPTPSSEPVVATVAPSEPRPVLPAATHAHATAKASAAPARSTAPSAQPQENHHDIW